MVLRLFTDTFRDSREFSRYRRVLSLCTRVLSNLFTLLRTGGSYRVISERIYSRVSATSTMFCNDTIGDGASPIVDATIHHRSRRVILVYPEKAAREKGRRDT